MTQILIDSNVLLAHQIVAGIAIVAFVLLLMFIISSPEIIVFLKAKMMKRPIVQIHTALKQTNLYAVKHAGKGKHTNRYELPNDGTKFTPLPEMVEHLGASRHINYYSKSALALDAKAVAAFRDVEKLLKAHSITPTESILDTVVCMTDEEVENLCQIDAESLDNIQITVSPEEIKEIRNELQNSFIKDGQFVWETAKNFVFLMQTETARSLDETIAIERERALDDARLGAIDKQTSMMILYVIMLLMGGAIAYKILVG